MTLDETKELAEQRLGKGAAPTNYLRMIVDGVTGGSGRIQQLWLGNFGQEWLDMPLEYVAALSPRLVLPQPKFKLEDVVTSKTLPPLIGRTGIINIYSSAYPVRYEVSFIDRKAARVNTVQVAEHEIFDARPPVQEWRDVLPGPKFALDDAVLIKSGKWGLGVLGARGIIINVWPNATPRRYHVQLSVPVNHIIGVEATENEIEATPRRATD